MDRPDLTTGVLTPSDVQGFGLDVCEVNWGVFVNGSLVACFQAEEEPDGWLNVHANVKRRSLHPALTYGYARSFSDRLIELGAPGLRCEIKNNNRAAIRVAAAAGFHIDSRNDEFTTLVKYGKQDQSSSDAVPKHDNQHIHGMDAIEYA